MSRGFKELGEYKGYSLKKIDEGGVVWSVDEVWLNCIFDTESTAKYFIDLGDRFEDNFYNVISDVQKRAIEINNGYVTREIVEEVKLK